MGLTFRAPGSGTAAPSHRRRMPASLPGASFNVSTSRRRLSRSLTDAFSGSVPSELGGASALFEQGPGTGHFRNIPIDRIRPGGDRPRRSVDPDALNELAASIRAHGVLQPIRVRTAGGGRYEIIAGERRWIAARQAGLRVIPALIAASDDEHAYVESLVENVQREDLNAVDRAHALRHLRVNLGLQSWEEVGRVLGITRQHVFNLLRVTQLPEPIQVDVRAGAPSEKHARALLLLRDDPEAQSRLWERIHDDELSGDAALDAAQRSRRHTSATARREVHPGAALLAALEGAAPGELLPSRGRLEELQERLASLLTAPPASRERVPPAAMGAVPVGHASAVNGEEWRSIVAPAAGNPAG